MPYYRDYGWKDGDMPTRGIFKHCISLPMYPTLTEDEQQFVINKVLEF
jgi:dTDP-4-amino-4,6-dideoxygalactose transaminase